MPFQAIVLLGVTFIENNEYGLVSAEICLTSIVVRFI